MKKRLSLGLFAMFATIIPAAPSPAAVSLSLSGDGGASGVTISAGQPFKVALSLTSTAENITAVDYFLQIENAGAGRFQITNRDITGSPFTDIFKPNSGDNSVNPGVLDASFSILNRANGLDLGGSIANISSPVGPGTSLLAQYTLATDPGVAPGIYSLSTTSLSGTGYEGPAPSFTDTAFDQHALFTVTVNPAVSAGAPEPTSVALAAFGFIALAARRRRR